MFPHLEVELFGVNQSARYQRVKRLLIEVLDRAGTPYRIEDIDQIDKFIEEGLPSVPSIRINHSKLFNVPHGDEPESVIQSVYDYLISNKKTLS